MRKLIYESLTAEEIKEYKNRILQMVKDRGLAEIEITDILKNEGKNISIKCVKKLIMELIGENRLSMEEYNKARGNSWNTKNPQKKNTGKSQRDTSKTQYRSADRICGTYRKMAKKEHRREQMKIEASISAEIEGKKNDDYNEIETKNRKAFIDYICGCIRNNEEIKSKDIDFILEVIMLHPELVNNKNARLLIKYAFKYTKNEQTRFEEALEMVKTLKKCIEDDIPGASKEFAELHDNLSKIQRALKILKYHYIMIYLKGKGLDNQSISNLLSSKFNVDITSNEIGVYLSKGSEILAGILGDDR